MPELARDPAEQCSYSEKRAEDAYHRRCVNKGAVDWKPLADDPWGPISRNCGGPHRFTAEPPVASVPDLGEVERWTRTRRQRYALAWAKAAFTEEQATNLAQRGLRLLEEAVELYQACVHELGRDDARARAHKLVDFVFGRPAGDIGQEIGGVSVCLLVLAAAADLPVDHMEVVELHRVLNKPVEEFTKRNAAKNAAGFLATATQPIDEDAAARNYVGTFRAFPDRPRTPEFNGATDEEIALFAAAWHHHAVYAATKNESQHDLRMSLGQLAMAARAWCTAHPNDHRVPTEIAAGVTDKNPTRMHTIKPDGGVPTLGLPVKTAPFHAVNPKTHNDPQAPSRGQLAEAVCDLIYEELGISDVNVYGRVEPMDRCEFVNKLVLLLMKNGWVHIERTTAKVIDATLTGARKMTTHFMQLSSERYHELEEIKRVVGGPHLEYVTGGATALSLVKELVEAHGHAQAMIKDMNGFAIADQERLKADAAPVPMILTCPLCGERHIDVGEFATKVHHTHACQGCGLPWRPTIGPTVGVQFLPGFKNEEK